MNLYNRVKKQLDKLSLRERAIILVALLAIVFGFWQVFLFAGESAERAAIKAATAQEITAQEKLTQQLDAFNKIINGDASREKKQKLDTLKKHLTKINHQLADLSQGLVDADHLEQLLQDVLKQTRGLELVSMHTLAAQPLRLVKTDKSAEKKTHAGVYRHTVDFTVSGSYFEVLDLLARLEALPWRFYWQSLHYSVSVYPRAKVNIKVYTLSAEEGLLGV